MAWFDCAVHKPISVNFDGPMGQNIGLFLHHAVARGSLYNFFNNPANQVSAQFWVSQAGVIEQYVDSNTVAWHAKQANGSYVGVETEGCVDPPYAEPMSDAMISALARLYAEGNKRHKWPFIVCNSYGAPGFGYHRLAVNTACPCDVRIAERPEILRRAQGITPTPPPVTIPKGETIAVEMISVNGVQYLVSNIVAGGHLVQVRQTIDSIGHASNGQNTSIIDLTTQWPGELSNVTAG